MKKLFALLLAVLMCLSLAACSGGGETPAEPAPAEEPAAETSGETFEELLAAGIANGNKLTIYSTHSVTVSALEAFHNKYCPDVECEGTQVGDTEQVTQVAQEVKEGVLGADIIFIQDGARVLTDLVDEGYVYNWYNDATAQPNNQCKYSYYGYIRADENNALWIIRDGVQEQFDAIPTDISTLPAVRYILPYPNQVIQRSAGAYKNYYGY